MKVFTVSFKINGEEKSSDLSADTEEKAAKRLRGYYKKDANIEITGVTLKNDTGDAVAGIPSTVPVVDKKVSRGKAPKATGKNITDEKAVTKVKKEKKPVAPKKERRIIYPVTDLSAVNFVPKWVYANTPAKPGVPDRSKFSFVLLYDLLRGVAPDYATVSVDSLYRLATELDVPVVRAWFGETISPLKKRDVKARIQWCMATVLKNLDASTKTEAVKA